MLDTADKMYMYNIIIVFLSYPHLSPLPPPPLSLPLSLSLSLSLTHTHTHARMHARTHTHTQTHTHTHICAGIYNNHQFLCECVRGVLREPASSIKMSSTRTSVALKNLRMAAPSVSLAHLELADLEDFVFLLCDLWGVASETVKVYWLSNLFAAGKEATGKKVN